MMGQESMETMIYAVMGTISQTVGVTIALLLAIAMYRLQELDKSIQEGSWAAMAALSDHHELRRAVGEGRTAEVLRLVQEHIQANDASKTWNSVQFGLVMRMLKAIPSRKNLLEAVRFATLFAFSVMLFTVLGMINAPAAAARPGYGLSLVWASAAGLVMVLWSYWRLFRVLLR